MATQASSSDPTRIESPVQFAPIIPESPLVIVHFVLPMPSSNRPLRLLLLAVLALVLAALLWVLFGALHSAVALWRALRDLPSWAQTAALILIAALVLGFVFVAWRVLRPRRRKPVAVEAPKRSEVDARVDALAQQRVDTSALQTELAELDKRTRSAELYVTVFGEISAGKSSLIRALAPAASVQTDVLGGTTRAVAHVHAAFAGGTALTLADVPGTHEVAGDARERIARDE